MSRLYSNKTVWILTLLILFAAILPHLRYQDNGLTLDEAEYALAARKGFVTNWLDLDNAREQRHYHGPLVTHFMQLSVALFGQSDFFVQLPARLFGIGLPILLLWGCAALFSSGLWIGAIAGFSLAIMPTFVQISGVANMHTTAAFFIVLSFFLTLKLVTSQDVRYLYLQAVVLGLLFSTIEYGIIVAGIFGLTLLVIKNPYFHISKKITFSKHIVYAVLVLIATVSVVWIAGVFKLNFLRNLLYYFRYSESGHPILFNGELTRHVPWWAYLVWFKEIAPVWLLLSLLGLAGLLLYLVKSKFAKQYLVLFLYLSVLLAALFKQHIMSARYAIYVIPFLTLAGSLAVTRVRDRWTNIGTVIVVLLVIAQAMTNYKLLTEFSQGDPGFKQAAQYIQNNGQSNDRILSWYGPVLHYYLDDFGEVNNYNSGHASAELLQQIKQGDYRYILFYHNQRRRWPDDPGYLTVKQCFNLRYTYSDQAEYLWLYEYDPACGPEEIRREQ